MDSNGSKCSDDSQKDHPKAGNFPCSSLNSSAKSILLISRLYPKLSRDVLPKDEQIIPARQRKKILEMRKTLDESLNSFTSFTVNTQNTSLSGSSKNSDSSLLQEPSNAKLREEYDLKIKLLDELDNPLLYQPYYEEVHLPKGKNTKVAKNSSALELSDLGRRLREERGMGLESSEGSSSNGSSKAKLNKAPKFTMIAETDSNSPSDSVLKDEEEFAGEEKGFTVLKCRWLNILGVLLIATGILTLLLVTIIKDVAERNRNVRPGMYERLTEYVYPQLSAIRTSLVDPDTAKDFHQKVASDGEEWDLVFSDEFNLEGRTFYPMEDQFFEAVDIHYLATNDLEWYSPDLISTANGTLNIRLDALKTEHLFYRSGMLQSWNKMCFTQGMVEISARLPGTFESKGFWPGLWSLGNLARPGYMASTDGVWPYTYESCDAGITPNQSSSDGLSLLPGQRLNSCTCWREDHPNRGTGRGAPEFDILEGTFTKNFATVAQTLQIAPFDPWWLPDYDHMLIFNKTTSYMNTYVGTPQQEAISVITTLNETWFEKVRKGGKELKLDSQRFQTYNMEYRSDNKRYEDDYISFGTGSETKMKIQGSMLHPEGNIDWRQISKEPMSLVFNLGLSYAWSDIQWGSLEFPASLEIDYIRVYQPKGRHDISCDPDDYPTYDYIEQHKNAYMNSNLTSWKEAGYSFPKNQLVNGCN